jgi:CRP-like cAMP-binding protein
MDGIDVLQRVEAFQSLSDAELSAIGRLADEKRFAKGDRLFKEGDPATHLWIIAEGIIDLRFDLPGRDTSAESTISSLSPHQIIGWSSLVSPYKYKLSAYCVSDRCRMMSLDGDLFWDFLKKHPATGYPVMAAMLRVVGKRFQALQDSAGAPFRTGASG